LSSLPVNPPAQLPVYLLDVSTLIALGVRQHQFHLRVATWVASRQFAALLTCPISELGFVRILAQTPEYLANVDQARTQLARIKLDPEYAIRFLPDDLEAAGLPQWVRTGAQTTDGHLAQLAVMHGAVLATLDGKIPGTFVIP
jgi:predicted nucleic acid-binding protein